MAEDEDGKEYRWETGYEKTWEALQEDEDGLLEASVADIIQRAKRKRQVERKGHTKLGMMRHLYLIIDSSEAMLDQDLKPTRQLCTNKLLEGFIEEFFDQNPISQMGLIATRNKRADKVSELAGNARKHLSVIQTQFNQPSQCSGEPSLQNALKLAASSLKNLPSHASREILIILGSLTTCDPGDINQTISMLKSQNIRVSVIGLAAEVRICNALCRETGGTYSVVLDDRHFRDLLFQHVEPPPTTASNNQEASLIKMGFPHHEIIEGRTSSLTMCMCHLESTEASKLKSGGYFCPQCRSKYCELPTECRVCSLTLVSAPHLARSYHHLFPVQAFTQLDVKSTPEHQCYACRKKFDDADKYQATGAQVKIVSYNQRGQRSLWNGLTHDHFVKNLRRILDVQHLQHTSPVSVPQTQNFNLQNMDEFPPLPSPNLGKFASSTNPDTILPACPQQQSPPGNPPIPQQSTPTPACQPNGQLTSTPRQSTEPYSSGDQCHVHSVVYNCVTCRRVFCLECDMFIHDTLHTCPGCATNQSTFLQQAR